MGWYLVSAGVLAVILGSVLLLAANLYVQSQAVQLRIRQALAATLRMPVRIQKTTLTYWEGLRIDGITARPGPAGAGERPAANSVRAASFRVSFSLRTLLFGGRLTVSDVLLDRPEVAWAQDPEGRWQFPVTLGRARRPKADPLPAEASFPSGPPAADGGETPSLAEPPPSIPPSVAAHATGVAPPGPKPEDFVLSVGRFRLRHGGLEFLNKSHGLVGRFDEVNLDGHLASPAHADGAVWCEKAALPRLGVRLTQFHSQFRYDHQEGLTLSGGRAGLAGGVIQADYRLRTGEPDSPFALECHLENVSLGQFVREAGSRASLVEGTLRGGLSVAGRSDDPESRTATGRFELADARVKDFPLFQVLGDALGISDLSHLQFKQAQLDYTVEGTSVRVDPLVLISNDLQIRAQGRYQTQEDRLDLHARLTVDAAVGRHLPGFITEKFRPCGSDAPGSQYLDFDIKGPLSKPTTDLYKRALPGNVGSLLQGLLGSKPKRGKTPPPAAPPPEAEVP